jgi:TPR repeat protein
MKPNASRLVDQLEKQGKFAEIRPTLEALADKDDIGALRLLWEYSCYGLTGPDGTIYIRRSAARARHYTDRAAELGDAGSITSIADKLTASGNRADYLRGVAMYHQAIRKGYATAMHNLALSYLNAGAHTKAVRWYRRAATARIDPDESALLEVARAELHGVGTRRNPRAAIRKLEKIARSKTWYHPPFALQIEAMIVLGEAYTYGWVVPRDYELGRRWLKRAASAGSKIAEALLTSW